jgi:hypothetical protein
MQAEQQAPPAVERLDHGRPPPGYTVGLGVWGWVFTAPGDSEEHSPKLGASEALAAAWAHYRATCAASEASHG